MKREREREGGKREGRAGISRETAVCPVVAAVAAFETGKRCDNLYEDPSDHN